MKKSYSFLILVVLFLCFNLNTNLSFAGDSISWNESLSIGQTIVSSGGKFELGFFQPENSLNYYIGIWYKEVPEQTVVWVANRETPVSDASQLTIIHGNLILLDKIHDSIWSALSGNVIRNISVTAVLHDDGNLILSDMSNSSAPLLLWQSFDYPTDTLLPGAKLGYDKRTQKRSVLTSWKHLYDPAPGLFSLELDSKHGQFVLKWNRTTQYWASGSWNGNIFSSVPDWLNTVYNYSYIDNQNELYFTYSPFNRAIASRWNMGLSGQVQQLSWSNGSIAWNLLWLLPRERCEVYASCGAFGVCSNANTSCNCLSGFKPRSTGKWNSKDYSGGCVRIGKLQCSDIAEDNDSFWMNFTMRLPIPQYTNVTVEDTSQCRSTCFNSCSCNAYTYDGSSNCSIWAGDLFNLEQVSEDETGRTIFVKRGSPEAQTKATKSMKLIALLSSITTFMALLIGSFSYIYFRGRRRRRRAIRAGMEIVDRRS